MDRKIAAGFDHCTILISESSSRMLIPMCFTVNTQGGWAFNMSSSGSPTVGKTSKQRQLFVFTDAYTSAEINIALWKHCRHAKMSRI